MATLSTGLNFDFSTTKLYNIHQRNDIYNFRLERPNSDHRLGRWSSSTARPILAPTEMEHYRRLVSSRYLPHFLAPRQIVPNSFRSIGLQRSGRKVSTILINQACTFRFCIRERVGNGEYHGAFSLAFSLPTPHPLLWTSVGVIIFEDRFTRTPMTYSASCAVQ